MALMDAVTDLVAGLGRDHAAWVLVGLAVASFVEAALGLGALLPGETVVVVGAVALGGSRLAWLGVPAAGLGAFAGDHVGYLLGRRSGPALRGSRLVARVGRDRWDRAARLLEHHGPWVIVVARLLPGVRTLVAAVAGAAGLSYRRFAPASLVGSHLWALLWVGGGLVLGRRVLDVLGAVLAWGAAALTVAVVLSLVLRAARRQSRSAASRSRQRSSTSSMPTDSRSRSTGVEDGSPG